jgi:hypothetical protein
VPVEILSYFSPYSLENRSLAPFVCWCNSSGYRALGNSQNTPQALRKSVLGMVRIVGGHVVGRAVLAGGFFQHVCGNSEPVSAV